jgi:endo-alpha-1,4-polygalactosaminidase (GH114 family)
VTYANLKPGTHTVKVTAKNTFGSVLASYTWTVEALPLPLPCVRDGGGPCYAPAVSSSWQWQLNPDATKTSIDPSTVADMYDIDGYANDAPVIAALKALPGSHVSSRGVTCYITAGTLENWRADSEALNPEVLGNPYAGFADERWIDVRAISQIRPWLEAKMDMCKSKGFDAIEFDNVDGWEPANKTGLNITAEDEIAFIAYMANAAHQRGLTMAHKSNVEQVPAILSYVDFAVVEECFAYKECTRADPNTDGQYGYDDFVKAGKPVFEVEYKTYDPTNNVCAKANALGFSTLYKHVVLDSYRVACGL